MSKGILYGVGPGDSELRYYSRRIVLNEKDTGRCRILYTIIAKENN